MKCVKIYIQETKKSYERRSHETHGIKRYLKDKTEPQPNYRGNRALRTIQGLDYLTAMRGLKIVEFYDFDQWLAFRTVKSVRDFTFVEDVTNQVCRKKDRKAQHLSKWRNLTPTVTDYVPIFEFWEALKAYMGEKNPIPEPQGPPEPQGLVPLAVHAYTPVIDITGDDDDSGVDMNSNHDADDEADSEGDPFPGGSHQDHMDEDSISHGAGSNGNDLESDNSEGSDSDDDGRPHTNADRGGFIEQQPTIIIDDADDEPEEAQMSAQPNCTSEGGHNLGGDLGLSISPSRRFGAGGRPSNEVSRSRTAESALFLRGSTEPNDAGIERSVSAEAGLFVGDPPRYSPSPASNHGGSDESSHQNSLAGPGAGQGNNFQQSLVDPTNEGTNDSQDVEMEDVRDNEGRDGDIVMVDTGTTAVDLTMSDNESG